MRQPTSLNPYSVWDAMDCDCEYRVFLCEVACGIVTCFSPRNMSTHDYDPLIDEEHLKAVSITKKCKQEGNLEDAKRWAHYLCHKCQENAMYLKAAYWAFELKQMAACEGKNDEVEKWKQWLEEMEPFIEDDKKRQSDKVNHERSRSAAATTAAEVITINEAIDDDTDVNMYSSPAAHQTPKVMRRSIEIDDEEEHVVRTPASDKRQRSRSDNDTNPDIKRKQTQHHHQKQDIADQVGGFLNTIIQDVKSSDEPDRRTSQWVSTIKEKILFWLEHRKPIQNSAPSAQVVSERAHIRHNYTKQLDAWNTDPTPAPGRRDPSLCIGTANKAMLLSCLCYGCELAENYNFVPHGLTYKPCFLQPKERQTITKAIEWDDSLWKTNSEGLRYQEFGFELTPLHGLVLSEKAIPKWGLQLLDKLETILDFGKGRPNQLTVNEYKKGQGTNLSADSTIFDPDITIINLISPATLAMVNCSDALASEVGVPLNSCLQIFATPGDLFSISGTAIKGWERGSAKSERDLDQFGNVISRQRRLTLTFRRVNVAAQRKASTNRMELRKTQQRGRPVASKPGIVAQRSASVGSKGRGRGGKGNSVTWPPGAKGRGSHGQGPDMVPPPQYPGRGSVIRPGGRGVDSIRSRSVT